VARAEPAVPEVAAGCSVALVALVAPVATVVPVELARPVASAVTVVAAGRVSTGLLIPEPVVQVATAVPVAMVEMAVLQVRAEPEGPADCSAARGIAEYPVTKVAVAAAGSVALGVRAAVAVAVRTATPAGPGNQATLRQDTRAQQAVQEVRAAKVEREPLAINSSGTAALSGRSRPE
jgi:hypothetical protein